VEYDGGLTPVLETAQVSERMGERVDTSASLVDVRLRLPAQLGFRIAFDR
jgi:hypothetical protein